MNRHDEAHAACLNILNDNEHSAPRIAELCTFTRQLGGEVDALRAELARVKAESLRVVNLPDEGKLYDWYMTPTGLGYPGKDRKQNNCIESAEGYYRLDECKPVRLERWEDE